jgi:hypothetical protein
MSFDNTNRGALFKNQQHERDTDADYRGTLNIDGAEFWLNAWLKTSKAGEKYMSLSVREKQVPKARAIPGRTDEDGIDF